jgi:hypothetical protein
LIEGVKYIIPLIFTINCSGGGGDEASPKTDFRTFITAVTPNGDLVTAGGLSTAIASADKLCNDDSNKPNTSTYKAMLVDGVNRVACTSASCATGGASEHVDWVFKANAKYYRSDGTTLVFTANANGVFDFGPSGTTYPLTNSFGPTGIAYWTGLDQDWRSDSTEMCGGSWASSLNTNMGDFGNEDRTNAGAIGGGANLCSLGNNLLCVEQ